MQYKLLTRITMANLPLSPLAKYKKARIKLTMRCIVMVISKTQRERRALIHGKTNTAIRTRGHVRIGIKKKTVP
jgi:hypothetical protein